MTDATEKKILTQIEEVTKMLDSVLVQLRHINLQLTEVIIRLPLEPTSHTSSAPLESDRNC